MEILNKTINISQYYNEVTTGTSNFYCKGSYLDFFVFIILPIMICLIILFLLLFRNQIKNKFMLYMSDRGYIRIWLIKENQKLKSKLLKLDKYNMFDLNKRRYSLEKMQDFVIGYDEYNFPIFLFDNQFILPLKINKVKMDKIITEGYNIDGLGLEEADKNKLLSQITMSLDSSILKLVYDKKLMSDLYSITRGNLLESKWFYLILGIGGIAFLYYTGYLEKIISMITG